MQYHYIDLTIHAPHPHKAPPYYTGSMIRGALGHALKRVTCINPSYQCTECFAADRCVYYAFYERETLQHKFRIDITLGSNRYDFGLYLFGEACRHLPYLLSSLEAALRQNGIGRERTKFEEVSISVDGKSVYEQGHFLTDIPSYPREITLPDYTPNIKLQLLTPLRIKKNNAIEYSDIEFRDIVRSVYQREQQIFADTTVHSLDFTPSCSTSIKLLERRKLYRKSDRQGRKIPMDGAMGEFIIMGIDAQSYRLLRLGEILGAGKQTTFGLGKLRVEVIKS